MMLSAERDIDRWRFVLVASAVCALFFLPIEVLAQQEIVETPKRLVRPQFFTEDFYTRLATNVLSVGILVMAVYLPIHRKKDYFFAFLILNFLVFIITYLINKTTAFSGMGTAALGLLAFFSLLRLRTETINMKDMTYLFVVVTLGLVNATVSGPYYELITLDVVIVGITFGLDKDWLSKSIHRREIKVDSLENIVPQQTEKLMADLRAKTGLDIQRVQVESVDLVKKRALIYIYHY